MLRDASVLFDEVLNFLETGDGVALRGVRPDLRTSTPLFRRASSSSVILVTRCLRFHSGKEGHARPCAFPKRRAR
jgi:hypothetical protein